MQFLPKWLLTNQQMLAEGLAQFRCKATWLVLFPECLNAQHVLQPLLHPATAPKIVVRLGSASTCHKEDMLPVRTWSMANGLLEGLYRLFMEKETLQVENLEFRTYLYYGQEEDENREKEEEDNEPAESAAHDEDDTNDDSDNEIFDFTDLHPPSQISDTLSVFGFEVREFKGRTLMPQSVKDSLHREIDNLGRRTMGGDASLVIDEGAVQRAPWSSTHVKRFVYRRAEVRDV